MFHSSTTRRRARRISVAAVALLVASPVAAQELPQPSPPAKVEQRVGVTDFSVQYSSPGVKGRRIWGGLVPYDQPWRTGANAATKLTASRDFTFGDKKVPAGEYALYTIPGKNSWTVILNTSSEQWGSAGFDKAKDVARITVKPQAIPSRERMAFIFSEVAEDSARLDLEWEKVRLPIPIKVDTRAHVQANIDKALSDAWRPHFASARWMLENGGDLNKALSYADTSIAIKPTWWNNWIRAQILAKQGKPAEAVKAAETAQELGKGDRVYEGFFKGDVEKAVAEWKKRKA